MKKLQDFHSEAVKLGRAWSPPSQDRMTNAAFTHRSDADSVIYLQNKVFHVPRCAWNPQQPIF